MTQTLHPTIASLDISLKAKRYLNKLEFYDIITDKVLISTDVNKIDEAMKNLWVFSIDWDSKKVTKEELLCFYKAVVISRSNYLKEHFPAVKMVFYTWYDDLAGNLRFSMISDTKGKLPFGCNIHHVDSISVIIQEYIDGEYKGFIPISEFEDVTNLEFKQEEEDSEEEERLKNYVLNVRSIELPITDKEIMENVRY
jgi:hypothetical protein